MTPTRAIPIVLAPFLSAAMLVACSEVRDPMPCELGLAEVLPASDATDVPVDARVLLSFHRRLYCSASVYEAAVLDEHGAVLFHQSFDAVPHHGLVSLVPDAALAADTAYDVFVRFIGTDTDDAAALGDPWPDATAPTSTFVTGTDAVLAASEPPNLEVDELWVQTEDGERIYSVLAFADHDTASDPLAVLHLYAVGREGAPIASELPQDDGETFFSAEFTATEMDEVCFVVAIEDGTGAESQQSETVCLTPQDVSDSE